MAEFSVISGITILIFALVGWALCFAVMGIGMKYSTMDRTLKVHAIAAPVIFVGLSLLYFSLFNFTTPLVTAVLFVVIVILMDFFVVALLIIKSLDMFRSIIGTWIPFLLIFLATYLTGLYLVG